MTQQVFAYIIYKDGVPDDTALELLAAAGKLDPDASVTAVIAGDGNELDSVCNEIASSFAEVWKIDNPALAYVTAEVVRPLLVSILPRDGIVLVPHDHFGMDLAPGLSIKLDAAYLPDVVDFEGIDNGKLKAVREEYAGQVSTHVLGDISQGAVITVRPGSFKADERKSGEGLVIDKTAQAVEGGLPAPACRFLEIIEAEVGDVDITKSDILVSVGRGIEDQDNMEMIFELAEAMGGDVSCSRPVVDAKWLEKSRKSELQARR